MKKLNKKLNKQRTKQFKYVSLFSGIGGFEQALNKLEGECVMASEIDTFANKSYEAIYGHKTVGDITKVKDAKIPEHDMLVGGFPCQSFSVAGKRGGFNDARGTLFFQMARIAKAKQPKVIFAENVKGLVSHDEGVTLDTIVKTLNDIGYRVDFKILDSKYFDVPQQRERIFILAFREDLIENEPWINISGDSKVVSLSKQRISAYKDVKTFNFNFPKQIKVTKRLRDILEDNVSELFYLSEKRAARLINQLEEKEKIKPKGNLLAGEWNIQPEKVASMYGENSQSGNVWNKEKVSPTLTTSSGGHKEPFIVEDKKTKPNMVGKADVEGHESDKRVYAEDAIAPTVLHKSTKIAEDQIRVRSVGNVNPSGNGMSGKVYSTKGGLSPTLVSSTEEGVTIIEDDENLNVSLQEAEDVLQKMYRIRKLTPLECLRLQGFPDSVYETLKKAGISNSQLYKQAGNAVTVNVIEAIAKEIIKTGILEGKKQKAKVKITKPRAERPKALWN